MNDLAKTVYIGTGTLIMFLVFVAWLLLLGVVSFVRWAAWPLVVLAFLIVSIKIATSQEYHSNPELLKWIPATCCVTNDCCWEISSREVKSLPDDEWEIRSTGQVRKRTGWSPDGKYYRCACDYDNVANHWNKHQGANTRCIFVPMQTGARQWTPRHSRVN